MRTPMVAGNWKMNKTIAQAKLLLDEQIPLLQAIDGVEIVICPPFTSLSTVAEIIKGNRIGLGAQNLHWEVSGAFTGEISAAMIQEVCQYVIIGHSERRTYFGENDESVNKKVQAALAMGLIPIVCVGETLIENESGMTGEVLRRQLLEGLPGLDDLPVEKIVIAYEPVWAIGTGRAATGEGANGVITEFIRPVLAELFGIHTAAGTRVLYGGSVTSVNAAEFFGQSDIDGALVGGASLKPDFIEIVKAAVK